MKLVYGYVRVPNSKRTGSASLREQRKAIEDYAKRHRLCIFDWFEEKESEKNRASTGFNRMFKRLKARSADGAILHIPDRDDLNIPPEVTHLINEDIEVYIAR